MGVGEVRAIARAGFLVRLLKDAGIGAAQVRGQVAAAQGHVGLGGDASVLAAFDISHQRFERLDRLTGQAQAKTRVVEGDVTGGHALPQVRQDLPGGKLLTGFA